MKTIKYATFALTFALAAASVASSMAAGWGWDRNAGDKVRGQFGGSAMTQRSTSAAYVTPSPSYANPAVAGDEGGDYAYRSFSYQPSPAPAIKVGDGVTVVRAAAPLMVGNQVLTTIEKGQRLTVIAVQGQWLGVQAAGKSGWLRLSDSALAK
jgi:hypothetical protein